MCFSARNNIKKLLYTLIFSFLYLGSTFSQYNKLSFKHLTDQDGLSQNYIVAILQDKDGFMWFSTKDGLNKYDGYEFQIFHYEPLNSNSISGNNVLYTYIDSKGRLWIGANTLNLFDPEKNVFDKIDLSFDFNGEKNFVPFNFITTITGDKNGVIWIGTNKGLLYCNPSNKAHKFFNFEQDSVSNPGDNFICSLSYKDSLLYIGTNNGLKILNTDTIKLNKNEFAGIIHFTAAQLIANKRNIISQFQSSSNILYCGTPEGLIRIDLSKKTSQDIPYKNYKFFPEWLRKIVSICGDNQGNLWLASPGGLVIYDTNRDNFHYYFHDPLDNNSLSINNVTFVYADRQGKIWIGTGGKGINIYDQNRKAFSLYNGLSRHEPFMSRFSVYAVLEDSRNELWISNRQQVYRLDRNTEEYYPVIFPQKSVRDITSILEDTKKNIWISSNNGIYKMTEGGKITAHYIYNPSDLSSLRDNYVKLLYIDKEGTVFAFNSNYLSKLDEKSGFFIHYKLNFDTSSDFVPIINTLKEDKEGWFWIGWSDGLVKYNLKSQKSFIFRHKPGNEKSLSSNNVLTICSDPAQPDKYLWLGTDGGGLNRFNIDTETFKSYSTKDGLPNDVIYGILSSGKNELWLSTNKGLSKVEIDDNGITHIKNFDEDDGLQGNEFNTGAYSKSHDGELFFGGLYGVTAFFPSKIKENTFIPPVVFTELKFLTHAGDNNSGTTMDYFPDSSTLTIPYSENSFSISFASLDFTEPEKNQYKYLLRPINKNWINIGTQRYVIFTDLAPGHYEFRVKGSNNDGIWNDQGAVMEIMVQHPFWSAWWAYVIYILIAIGVLYSFRRYELNRQLWKHSLELETIEAFKYKEINELKSRFFSNISHEFRTPLSLIIDPSENIINGSTDQNVLKQAGLIKRNAKRLLILINQLLDLSKLEAGKLELRASKSNIVSFIKGVTMSFESFAEKKDITIKVKAERDEISLYFDKEKMLKIMTNLLSNAIKYTGDGGFINVSIYESEDNYVKIKVSDTGIGIPSEELPKLFDRFYQVDSSHTREFGGTGIGLALVKELTELHSGSITVDSIEGSGTEFTVSLPPGRNHLKDYEIVNIEEPLISEVLADDKIFSQPKIEEADVEESYLEDRNIILVIEDNKDVLEYIRDSLKNEFKIELAINGEQGLRKAEQIIPDLIISDIMMPKMDGNELTRKLKNDNKTSHIPIILLTAKSDQQSRLEGLATGADDYLIKPFDTKELSIRIKNLIKIRENIQKKFSIENYKSEKKTDKKKLNILDEEFMNKVMEVAEKHLTEEAFSIEQFGKEVGMSRVHLHRKLKALTGKSASNFLKGIRLARGKELIESGRGNISEIAYAVGFSSPAYFTRCFKEEYGYPPSDLKD